MEILLWCSKTSRPGTSIRGRFKRQVAQDTPGEGAHQSIEMILQRLRTLCEFYLVLHIIQIVAHLTTES